MARRDHEPIRQDVEVEIDGEAHVGWYTVVSRIVTVTSAYGTKPIDQGALTPDQAARIALRELVRQNR